MAVICLSTANVGSSHSMTLDALEFVCPVDGKKFMAEVVGSYSQFSIRLDLRPQGALEAPQPRPVCPGSGFVMSKDTYTAKEVAAIKVLVASAGFSKARIKYNDNYMAAIQQAHLGEPVLIQAWSYHQAGWKAESGNMPDGTYLDFYRDLALKHFNKFFDAMSSTPTQKWWNAQIVAANLERKLGRFELAQKRITNLLAREKQPAKIVKLFLEQTRAQVLKKNKGAVVFNNP